MLLFLHVVAEQQVLVAHVQFAIGNDRMRLRLLPRAVWLLEAATFNILLTVWFDQDHRS